MPIICGIDEAGRGPLAGPVTASAVILNPSFPVEILKDSKKLSAKQRSEICRIIISESFCFSTGWAWPEEIDRINIHNAALLAMKRAYESLLFRPELTLVDGLFIPDIDCRAEAVVKGDNLVNEIKAASILAKTARDLWMIRYSWIEPNYCFEKHKGYPTKQHRQILSEIGLSVIHRKSFNWKSINCSFA